MKKIGIIIGCSLVLVLCCTQACISQEFSRQGVVTQFKERKLEFVDISKKYKIAIMGLTEELEGLTIVSKRRLSDEELMKIVELNQDIAVLRAELIDVYSDYVAFLEDSLIETLTN
ncbi:hypothetical protein ACFL1E_03865 [Candidatus Omnitrophota bacterium]